MILESIPLDVARRRQVLFELNEAVTLSAEEYEEIKPWVSNWFSNAKAGAYAPRFNTQRTYYRCLFHSQKAPPSASKGLRARPTRQPLEKPCPFTMSVVANYAPDGQTILTYTIDRTSTYDRCPDHTHDIDLVDQTHRPDGLRAIAYHKMWQMAPDAKASVVFQSMKKLPRFEDVGGKHFTCAEVYYIGMKFRKPTESMVKAKSTTVTSELTENPTPEAGEAPSGQENVTPPSWLKIKDRKRKRVAEARPPPKPHTAQSRYRPASTTHTGETSQNNPQTTAHRDDLLAHRQPKHSAQPRQLLDPTQPRQLLDPTQPRQHPEPSTGGRGRYFRNTTPGDIASRVRAILSRPTAGAEHFTPADTGYTPPPIDLTSSPGGYDPPPPLLDNSIQRNTWQPPQAETRRQQLLKHHSNTVLPNWMTANGPALLPTRSVQPGRSAVMIEAPVSIGDLLREAAPKDIPRQDTSTGNRYAKDNASGGREMQREQTVTNERATLSELLSMQPAPTVQRDDRERFPPNPFSE